MSDLKTDTIGSFYVEVDLQGYSGKKFPCAQLQLQLSINAIHRAVATIQTGRGIDENDSCDATGLMTAIQRFTQNSTYSTKLLSCRIYEQESKLHATQLVFKGYILNANFSYSAGLTTTTAMGVVLDCEGPATLLNIAPVAMYFDAAIGNVVNKIRTKQKVNQKIAQASGNSYSRWADDAFESIKNTSMGLPVSKILARCVNIVRHVNTYSDFKPRPDKVGLDALTLKAIGGNTYLNTKNLDRAACVSWIDYFYKSISAQTASCSLFQAILKTISITDFGLQLAPRWSCDESYDFRLAIKPVTTWQSKQYVNIDSTLITGITVQHNADYILQSADVIFVSFDEFAALTGGDYGESTRTIGIVGIAGRDQNLVAKLKQASTNIKSSWFQVSSTIRIKDYKGPAWLTAALQGKAKEKVAQEAEKAKNLIRRASPPKKLSQVGKDKTTGTKTNEAYPPSSTVIDRYKQQSADMAAQAIFNHIYGKYDVCRVALSPKARFGFTGVCLENHIGDTVNVIISTSMSPDTRFSYFILRGALQALDFSYTGGTQSGIRYQMTLTRARLVNSTGIDYTMECPFYNYN